MQPLIIGGLGAPELLIVLAVVTLLFGATKLPELARGSGRALRIFKAETKGLVDDDQDSAPLETPEPVTRPISTARPDPAAAPEVLPVAEPIIEPRHR